MLCIRLISIHKHRIRLNILSSHRFEKEKILSILRPDQFQAATPKRRNESETECTTNCMIYIHIYIDTTNTEKWLGAICKAAITVSQLDMGSCLPRSLGVIDCNNRRKHVRCVHAFRLPLFLHAYIYRLLLRSNTVYTCLQFQPYTYLPMIIATNNKKPTIPYDFNSFQFSNRECKLWAEFRVKWCDLETAFFRIRRHFFVVVASLPLDFVHQFRSSVSNARHIHKCYMAKCVCVSVSAFTEKPKPKQTKKIKLGILT